MTWIFLTADLPVQDAPPKMSIHWSEPNDMNTNGAREQINRVIQFAEAVDDEFYERLYNAKIGVYEPVPENEIIEWFMEHNMLYTSTNFGKEPNFVAARRIDWNGGKITIFPHEFSVPTLKNLRLYTEGDDRDAPSHILFPVDLPQEKLLEITDEGDLKTLYEVALMEGANPNLARRLVMMDFNPNDADDNVPMPIGWYCLHPSYAAIYGIDVAKYYEAAYEVGFTIND